MFRKKSFHREVRRVKLHRHPFAVPVATFIVLSFLTMVGWVILGSRTVGTDDAYVVQLSVDGKKQTLPTRAGTVQDFLDRAEIKLEDGDVVEPAADIEIDEDNFRVNVYRARPVTIFDGDKRIQALSAATTARSVAAQVGIDVYPEDRLKQEASSDVLRDQVIGDKITIERATVVNLNLYGTPVVIRTHSKTVADLLKEKNIALASGDSVQPAAETPITSNIQVFVTRSGTQITTVEEAIKNEVQIIEDPSLSFGSTATRQAGSPGAQLVTYELALQNGQEVGRKVIQKVRIKDPVTAIIARGPLGSFTQALALLRKCESGGNYANKSNPKYRGAYQYDYATWNNFAGFYDPADAPPAIQDQKAAETYQRRGWQPWPSCSVKLGLQDVYR